ncbi:M20 aminoacylase family protein [Phreatobacter sp. AB_2022a]|uniref:M20 aminoacylase family protein n=1 Tax=Phreatobacter sp. AB_2022a TaxID=3003134 RepID=UPI002286E74D|nr:M20 aminoacylase family protein [Phreatobacter sp. AB_2022a]MCZ0735059.1 M20 family metallopeptidase [Phreatobacter sp. AB_2022a]
MPINNRIAALHDEVTAWRRDLHEHPELQFDVHRTAGIVADKLKEFGCDEVVTGIGKTGVVGIIKGAKSGSGKVIGLRADMDALPLTEITGKPYASKTAGKMHACGHDGHTAMLLGAAKYLAETRNFDGTVAVIFQPAEEGGGGGREMVNDGLMERFGIQEVYGMHNTPGMPVGAFALRPGPLLAAADRIRIEVEGKGGHAAKPHLSIDTVLVASQIVANVQSIVSRNVNPLDNVVVSICAFNAGFTDNVIPQTATLLGTVRTLTPEMRDFVEARLHAIVEGTAALFGATAKLHYYRDYPVTRNTPEYAVFAGNAAAAVVGEAGVEREVTPVMGGEDFSFMLEARPGAFIFIGQGDSAGLHHPAYDFNDEIIPIGMSYWAKIVETRLAA